MRRKHQVGCEHCCDGPTSSTACCPIGCLGYNGQSLVLTDANGSHPMIQVGSPNSTASNDYFCAYQFVPPGGSVSAPGGVCVHGTAPVSVLYRINCTRSGTTGAISVALSCGFMINNDPCGGPPVHPYQLYQRSDSHPTISNPTTSANVGWASVNAGYTLMPFTWDPGASDAPTQLAWTGLPASGTNGSPFHDTYTMPAPGTVTIDIVPHTNARLILSDGFGDVVLVYGRVDPSLAVGWTAPTGAYWTGCATRTAAGLPSDCLGTPGPISTQVRFLLACDGTVPSGYKLYLYYQTCSRTESGVAQQHMIPNGACATTWSAPVQRIVTDNRLFEDECDPFVATFSHAFGSTPPYPALREIYGDSAAFTVSSP